MQSDSMEFVKISTSIQAIFYIMVKFYYFRLVIPFVYSLYQAVSRQAGICRAPLVGFVTLLGVLVGR